MTALPLLSVLTPSLNQVEWLSENLESVQRQTYPFVEHIVADGGSTDGSLSVLEEALGRVVWFSEPDQGQSDALNKAFRLSRGEIIGWLNSDDAFFSRRAIELAVAAFREHPNAAVVYGHSALVDGKNRLMHYNWAPPFSRHLLKMHNFIVQPAAFVRRSVLEEQFADRRFDYAMDRELWLRLTEQYDAVRVPEVLAIDRHHSGRKSYTRPDLYRHDLELLVERYGVPRFHERRVRLKVAKVAFRIAGAPLALRPGTRGSTACTIQTTGSASLLARQMLLPRGVISR
jgi:glycosyltransferase involved in cell wall biosynthesis